MERITYARNLESQIKNDCKNAETNKITRKKGIKHGGTGLFLPSPGYCGGRTWLGMEQVGNWPTAPIV
jgi:hypothetical protein